MFCTTPCLISWLHPVGSNSRFPIFQYFSNSDFTWYIRKILPSRIYAPLLSDDKYHASAWLESLRPCQLVPPISLPMQSTASTAWHNIFPHFLLSLKAAQCYTSIFIHRWSINLVRLIIKSFFSCCSPSLEVTEEGNVPSLFNDPVVYFFNIFCPDAFNDSNCCSYRKNLTRAQYLCLTHEVVSFCTFPSIFWVLTPIKFYYSKCCHVKWGASKPAFIFRTHAWNVFYTFIFPFFCLSYFSFCIESTYSFFFYDAT